MTKQSNLLPVKVTHGLQWSGSIQAVSLPTLHRLPLTLLSGCTEMIFHGDGAKIDKLNVILCQKASFPETFDISDSHKVDLDIADAIVGLCTTAMHIASDI